MTLLEIPIDIDHNQQETFSEDCTEARGYDNDNSTSPRIELSSRVLLASEAFPLTFEGQVEACEDKWRVLLDYIPPYDVALFLIGQHLTGGIPFIVPATHSQIFEHLLPKFYPAWHPISPSDFREDMLHDLALFYGIFASGSLLHSSQGYDSEAEAEPYMHLCRAALAFGGLLEDTSLSAVQAVFLLAMNIQFSGKPHQRKLSDKVMSFAIQLAISVSSLKLAFFLTL